MPPKPKHTKGKALSIVDAVRRIETGTPRSEELKRRAKRGSLKLNFNTVAIESGVKRHLFDEPSSVYGAEHLLIVSKMPQREAVETTPMREQLDAARAEKATALENLALARTYAFHLLTRMHGLDLEVKRLTELLENGGGEPEEDLIGTGRVIGLPTRPKKPRGGPAARSAR